MLIQRTHKGDNMLKQSEGFYSYHISRGDLKLEHYIYPISIYRYNWHKEIELMVVLKGKAEVSVTGQVYLLQEDDFILIPPNVGHASLATEPDSIGMVVHLHPKFLSRWFSDIGQIVFQGSTFGYDRHGKEYVRIRYILAVMMETGLKTEFQAQMVLESYLIVLWTRLIQLFPPQKQEASAFTETNQKDIEKITTYIDSHYKEELGLSEISRIFQYNSSYFSRFLKSQLGIGYYEYLTRVRLRHATLDLCDKEKSILDVSEMNGFSNLKAFNAAFRKNFGKTPSEYRAQIRETYKISDGIKRHKRETLPVGAEYVEEKLRQYIREMGCLEKEEYSDRGNRMVFEEREDFRKKARREKLQKLIKSTENIREELDALYEEYCK